MIIKLKIDGMTCGGCEKAVYNVLAAVPSVVTASIDRTAGWATVETSADIDPQTLVSVVTDAGYEARVEA